MLDRGPTDTKNERTSESFGEEQMKTRTWAPAMAVALGGMVANAPSALAQTGQSAGVRPLEEIIVSARRREESLQDVPVSVGVVTAEMIQDLSIQNLDELSQYVPGLVIQEGGEQTGISVRGFGSGVNFGFDPSVGLFIDGVYQTRERQFRGRLMDVQRVEVLRGPQGTLFGKNTISGAVIVNTAEPSHEFGIDLRGEYTGKTDRRDFEAVINGGITETLAGRLAMKYAEQDGYLRNTFTGEDEEQTRDRIIRGSLLWTPNDYIRVRTKIEYSDFDRTGRNFNISRVRGLAVDEPLASGADVPLPAQLGSYLAYDPDFEFGTFDRTSKQRETADVQSWNLMVKADFDLGFGSLTSITGYSTYESEDERDVDWSPTNYLFEPITQDFDQYSQEIQFFSQVNDRFDYMIGASYFKNAFFVDRRTDIDINVFLLPFGAVPFDPMPFGGSADIWRYSQLRFLDQQTESAAIYGSGTWQLNDQWAVTAGARFGWEKKKAADRFDLAEFGSSRFLDPVNNPADFELLEGIRTVLGPNIAGIEAGARFGDGLSRSETDFSPELTVTWDPNPDMMYYGKVTRGFKGGGFNANTVGPQAGDVEFDEETVIAWELGGKLRLLDNTAQLNFALFWMDFEDLQFSTFTGDGFAVANVGKARSRGLEMDGIWRLTDRVQVNGSFIFLDAKYRDFPNAACSISQTAFGAPGCEEVSAGVFAQDLSGERFAGKFQGNLGVGYLQPLARDIELLLRADLTHISAGEFPPEPQLAQPSRTLLDLSATVRPMAQNWAVSLLVQNATDKDFRFFEFNAPAQTGTLIGFPAPPRRVTLRASYSF